MKKTINSLHYFDPEGKGQIVCELCGNPENNLHFKGKQICEDCVKYIKSY